MLLYKSIKVRYDKEQYLDFNNYECRKFVTKVRISDHNLPIETGRKKNIARNLRICTRCNLAIGDEKHVLFECTNEEIKNIRLSFYNKIHRISPQIEVFSDDSKLRYLLGLFDKNLILVTMNYICKILKMY